MNMETICEDVRVMIATFCTYQDVCNMMTVCRSYREMFGNDYIWVVLGERDHPLLEIKDRNSYCNNQPLYVSDQKVRASITRNRWATNWLKTKIFNWNNKQDHIISAYIYSIMKAMEQVYKLRRIKQRYQGELDWKIAINIKIKELLSKSEDERDELYEHVLSLQPCNAVSMKDLISKQRF